MVSIRVDRWLSAARIFKSRTLASTACADRCVQVNGAEVRASYPLKVGDEVTARAPRGTVILEVKQLSDRRLSAALARALYTDHSPPPPPREQLFPARDAGMGRPTKHERRELSRVRGR